MRTAPKKRAQGAKTTAPKHPRKTKSLVKPEPPDEGLTPQQMKVLDDAVTFVNTRIDRTATSLIEIGQHLLKQFFGNDPEKVGDRAPRKGISLRKLADHPDINMSFAGLSNAVGLAVQEKQLGTVQTSEQLTASHRVLLLKVEDLQSKKQYISQIEKNKLSVRRFHELLEKDGLVQRRGLAAVDDEQERKLLRSGYHKFLSPFESLAALEIDSVLELPKDRIKSIYSEAKKAMSQLEKLLKRLEQAVG